MIQHLRYSPSFALLLLSLPAASSAAEELWLFDNVERIGGFDVQVEGEPRLIDGPAGAAMQFDGVNDSMLVQGRALVGAPVFTIEAIFRPDGGAVEQRFLHIATTDPLTGLDTRPGPHGDPNPRFMFEVRIRGDHWYLDCFVKSEAGARALAPSNKLHALGRWYAVAQSYDGKTYRAYVDGVLEAEADVPFSPHGRGRVRVGARMNRIDHFKGAIAQARFTDRELPSEQLLRVPDARESPVMHEKFEQSRSGPDRAEPSR